MLTITNLCKSYQTRQSGFFKFYQPKLILDHLCIRIEEGQCLGLVGESGSGKSTLARVLAGLEGFDKGTIDGNYKPVQMVFQDPQSSLDPKRSAGYSIKESLHSLGLSALEREDITDQVLLDVGLKPADKHKMPHEFSGGQKQRIAIARAIAPKPKLLIADEPVSALDVSIQAQILILLRELQKNHQITSLFITHDLAVVSQVSDKLAVIKNGQIVEHGDTKSVLSQPQDQHTKDLIHAFLPMDRRISVAKLRNQRKSEAAGYQLEQIPVPPGDS